MGLRLTEELIIKQIIEERELARIEREHIEDSKRWVADWLLKHPTRKKESRRG